MKIYVISHNDSPNSRAFNLPLFLSRRSLRANGVEIRFHLSMLPRLQDCDALMINSNVFRNFWKDRKSDIFSFLESSARRKQKIIWIDTTDSTWCTQFEVMPFVDLFLKNQIYADKRTYLKKYRTGRIFTDFFREEYKCEEKDSEYSLPKDEDLHKLHLGWNTCIHDYDIFRTNLFSKMQHRLPFPLSCSIKKIRLERFVSPRKQRPTPVSSRLGYSYLRPSVSEHRRRVAKILESMGCDCRTVPIGAYFNEMENARIGVSPFGLGEICYRDFEIIRAGAALVKPDMSHMVTWPDLYQPGRTFVTHRWDLHDLQETVQTLEKNDERRIQIAEAAQNVYRHHVSVAGIEEFSSRILSYLKQAG